MANHMISLITSSTTDSRSETINYQGHYIVCRNEVLSDPPTNIALLQI
jgi:hypothetical protein